MDESHEIFDQLVQLCRIRDFETFISELNRKESVLKIQDATGKTVLHYCAEQIDIRFAKEILGRNSEIINNKDTDGFTALHLGVIAGNLSFVQLVLDYEAGIESLDNELHTAVHWAIVCGDLEILKSLIKYGALLSTPDIYGAHPLHYAAQVSNTPPSLEMLRYLLKNKADVNAIDNDGRSPILWAASSGCKDALLEIYNAGATITTSDKDGLTALHCAASRGFTDCVEALIGLCGVLVDPPDNQETTPLFYSVSIGHSECTEVLLRLGADPNYRDLKGRTPGHFASFRGRLECLRLLHFYGADMWAPSERGDTPFLESVSGCKYDIIEWLLDGRPEGIRSSNSQGRSCLHIAALYNNLDIARFLLERDADINAVMRGSTASIFLTPLDVALRKGHIALAKFFQERGGVPATKVTNSRTVARALQLRSIDEMFNCMDSEVQSCGPCCRTPTSEHSITMATQTDDTQCSKGRQYRRRAPHVTNKKKSQGVLNDAELRMRSLQSSDEDESLTSGRIMVVVEKKSRNITPVNRGPEKLVWTNNQYRDQPESLNSTMTELKDSGISEVNIPINSRNSARSHCDSIEYNHRTDSEASTTHSYNIKVGSKQCKAIPGNKTDSNSNGKNLHCGFNDRQVYRVEAVNSTSKPSNRSPKIGRDKRNQRPSPQNLKPLTERSDDTGTLSSISRPQSKSNQRSTKSLIQSATEKCENPQKLKVNKKDYCLGGTEAFHKGFNIFEATDVNILKDSSAANCQRTKSGNIWKVPEYTSKLTCLQKRKGYKNETEKYHREGTLSCENTPRKASNKLNKTLEEEMKFALIPNRQSFSKNDLREEKQKLNKKTDDNSYFQGIHYLGGSIAPEIEAKLQPSPNGTDWEKIRGPSPEEGRLSGKTSSRRNSPELNGLTKQEINMIPNSQRQYLSENELNEDLSKLTQKQFGNHCKEITVAETREKNTFSPFSLQCREKWTNSPNFVTSSPIDGEYRLEENILDEDEAIDEQFGPILSASPCVSATIKEKTSDKEEIHINYVDNSAALKQCNSKSSIKLHFKENGEKTQSTTTEKEIAALLNNEKSNDSYLDEKSVVIRGTKEDENTGRDIKHIEKISKGSIRNNNQIHDTEQAHDKLNTNPIIEEAPGETPTAIVNPNGKEGPYVETKSVHKQCLATSHNFEKLSKIPKPQQKKEKSRKSDKSRPTLTPIHRCSREFPRLTKRTLPSFDRTNAIVTPVENRYHNCSRKPPLPISVTLANQIALRRYHTERRIFQQLLDLKQMQMRSHRANEAVLVKRLLDGFNKFMPEFGLRRYNGQYLFKPLEKFLFDQLRFLQTKQGHQILENCSIERNIGVCSHSTHKSHHAAHAYAGLPCSIFCRSNNTSGASVLPTIR